VVVLPRKRVGCYRQRIHLDNKIVMQALTHAESQLNRQLTAREIWEIGYRELRRNGIRNPIFLPFKD
jgi:hypothetical protein